MDIKSFKYCIVIEIDNKIVKVKLLQGYAYGVEKMKAH